VVEVAQDVVPERLGEQEVLDIMLIQQIILKRVVQQNLLIIFLQEQQYQFQQHLIQLQLGEVDPVDQELIQDLPH
tara:strand:- start:304 stop:528 length:225 start_codon:yes stop_codon:yes gene_type:complete